MKDTDTVAVASLLHYGKSKFFLPSRERGGTIMYLVIEQLTLEDLFYIASFILALLTYISINKKK